MATPCFTSTCSITMSYDPVTGLQSDLNIDPDGGLACDVDDGVGITTPHARAYRNAAAANNNASAANFEFVPLDTQSWDNDGIFTPVNGFFEIQTPGLYLVEGAVSLADNCELDFDDVTGCQGNEWVLGFFLNEAASTSAGSLQRIHRKGLTYQDNADDFHTMASAFTYRFDPGDRLDIRTRQDLGNGRSYNPGPHLTYMSVAWLSR